MPTPGGWCLRGGARDAMGRTATAGNWVRRFAAGGRGGGGGGRGGGFRGGLSGRTNEQLATLTRAGLPGQGMPPSQIGDAEMEPLTRFLRGLQPRERSEDRRVE